MKKLYILAFVCLLSNQIMAKCDDSVPKNIPTKVPPNYYGNSYTDSFKCAVSGEDELTTQDLRERSALLPEKLRDRFYLRFGFNAASTGVSGAKNQSPTELLGAGTIVNKSAKTASNNIELAFGYLWKDFALDIEWLGLKSIKYDSAITNTTTPINFYTNVKGDAILGNIFWIFKDFYNFNLYGIFSIGVTSNKSTTIAGSSTSTAANRLSPSFGAGGGLRFNVYSSLFADMGLRYLFLGRVRYEAISGTTYFQARANRTWLGLSVRIFWLI